MIEWFTWVQVWAAVAAGLLCLALGFAAKKPNDYSLGALLVIELLLIAQLVIAIIAPAVGNPPSGNLAEFYVYLVSALLLPPAAVFWALIERTRWSTVILGVVALAAAVMVYRMYQIWVHQVA